MRVLQVGKYYPPYVGGIETFVYNLTEELIKYINVDILCFNKSLKTQIDNTGKYHVYRIGSMMKISSTPISPAMIFYLNRIYKNYDILHVHLPNPMANLAYFLVRPSTKLIIHWHSDIIKQKILLKFYEPLLYWFLKRADIIIATSPNYINSSRYLSKFKEKTIAIPVGINPKNLIPKYEIVQYIKRKYTNKPIIFSLGRLVYYKGFEFLIKAMKYVDAYLIIGGDGPLKQKLENLIKELNLSNKVFLIGKIKNEEIGSYYQACDIFCLPSIERSEAFGLVQVEAMFFGKPIVSTNIKGSGVSWVNQHKITGLIVEPKNHLALANALNTLIKDEKLRKRLGKNAKKRAKEMFHIEIVSKKILDVYQNLLKKNDTLSEKIKEEWNNYRKIQPNIRKLYFSSLSYKILLLQAPLNSAWALYGFETKI